MATFYYITATAPATLLVSGRRIHLNPGDSRGPFSEAEKNQIMSGPDRRRLVSTSFENAAKSPPPEVKPTPVTGLGLAAEASSEQVTPEVPTSGVSYEESKAPPSLDPELLNVDPKDVNEPLTKADKAIVEESITETLPEAQADFGSSNTSETQSLDPEQDSSEEAQEETNPRPRKRRRAS